MKAAGGTSGLLARTTYGQELPGAPTTAFYHADGNGNVTALVYPNQQLAAKYLYDPFGNMLAMSGPLMNFNKYRFSCKEWNDNSGLYYFGYRFYDPSLQRWLNRDPIGEHSDFNVYRYCNNEAVNLCDFRGLDWGGQNLGTGNNPSSFDRTTYHDGEECLETCFCKDSDFYAPPAPVTVPLPVPGKPVTINTSNWPHYQILGPDWNDGGGCQCNYSVTYPNGTVGLAQKPGGWGQTCCPGSPPPSPPPKHNDGPTLPIA